MSQLCLKCTGVLSTTLASVLEPPGSNSSLDLTQLLTSNNAPLDSEFAVIQDIVSEGQNQVDALDAQIHVLQASLAELVRRRDDTAERVRQHRAMISPVRRVPPELICDIFNLTLLSNDFEDRDPKPPWHLGHICRSWRHAALSFTPLWSSITIPSSLSFTDNCLLSAIEAQLFRTAHASLDIYWRNVQSDVDSRLLDLILPHCSRWRSLCFRVKPRDAPRRLDWLNPVNGHLHRLEKLKAVSIRHTVIPGVFSTAPNLRQVILSDEDFLHSSTSILIPWGQITHYRGTYNADRQIEILRNAPNVVECVAGFRKFRSFSPHPTLTVIMPYLRRLSVEEDRVLLHLEAPLLEELTSVWVGSSTVLLPFIRRSSCTLKKLLLMRCTMISSDLIAVLQSLPSLTYPLLAMDEDEENEGTVEQGQVALFSAMHLSGVPSDVCPNLTSFVFGYRRAFPWQSFFAMAQTRFQPETGGQCHLSFLRIFDADLKITYPQDMVTGTRLLQEEGLDVALVDVDSEEQLRSSFSTSFFSHY